MEEEAYLGSSVLLAGRSVAVKDVANAFEAQMGKYYHQHDVFDLVELERLERLRIWDEESSSWHFVLLAGASLNGMLLAEQRGEAQKLLYAKHVMQQYYERILDGEAVRNEMLEKHRALSKAKRAALLGDE